MPTITINGKKCDFTPGQTILQVANENGVEIPQYCYHDGLSIVASCRICLAEIWAPDPKSGQLVAQMGGKLQPTCQTPCSDGAVVYTDSPKSVANQKAVMEYLLINHPLDCPVCDQAGECSLQDYSYEYGRGVSRFQEQKVKQPKKDLGPHVLLYSDRCIMCTRCVRFTKEVAGSAEIMVAGRGNKEEIDVFPGIPLANELSANVVDLCPVGALLDKDFLFAQRVWFLKSTPSIDGITASGDNIFVEHNQGKVYRIKPRTNLAVNKWWITDEVRYGWRHVHADDRLRTPYTRQYGALVEADFARAYEAAVEGVRKAVAAGNRAALLVSPMLPCEEAFLLAKAVRELDPRAILGVGPVPVKGQDKVFPAGAAESDKKAFKMYAEKAPNARGVRRVLAAFGPVLEFADFIKALPQAGAVVLTGAYPEPWSTRDLENALDGRFVALIDTHHGALMGKASVVIPGATWVEKAGTFENAKGILQAFEQAIPVIELAKNEGQIALDLHAEIAKAPVRAGEATWQVIETTRGQVAAAVEVAPPRAKAYNAANVRIDMARDHESLAVFATGVALPLSAAAAKSDMPLLDL